MSDATPQGISSHTRSKDNPTYYDSAPPPVQSCLKKKRDLSIQTAVSRADTFDRMGCELSKINPKVCLCYETDEMKKDYVKEHGIEKYKEVQGIKLPDETPSVDDHSRHTNLGLINIETKNETEHLNEYLDLGCKDIVEIVVALLIII